MSGVAVTVAVAVPVGDTAVGTGVAGLGDGVKEGVGGTAVASRDTTKRSPCGTQAANPMINAKSTKANFCIIPSPYPRNLPDLPRIMRQILGRVKNAQRKLHRIPHR
ncbi:MAG: hypothetical protein R3E31_06600 [Chloroflexota bacterium]